MARYRLCGGLAIMPEHDMAMLADMSARGWHCLLYTSELARRHRRASSVVERFDGATLLLHEKRRAAQSYEAELRVTLEANAAKRAQAEADRAQAVEQLAEVQRDREQADANVARLASEQSENAQKRRSLEREAEELERAKRDGERAQEQARRELAETQEALTLSLIHI